MLHNYLTVAWRHLVRHKLYSVINIVGLAIGLTCMIFVVLFIRDQLSYDKGIAGTENLYRVEMTINLPNRTPLRLATVPNPLPETMKDEIAGVIGMTRLHRAGMTVSSGGRQFEQRVDVVDPNFFRNIQLPFVVGNAESVFRQPESVVLSQSAARKYFGTANPIGRLLTFTTTSCHANHTPCQNHTVPLAVTGIVRNLPHNSQLSGSVFIPDTSIADRAWNQQRNSWFSENGWGYVRLAPGVEPAAVVRRMAPVFDKVLGPAIRAYKLHVRGSQIYEIHLTRFTRVHLHSAEWQFNMTPPGSWTTIYGVAAVGMLILLTACFNFMNLATALSQARAREIALRKIVGARRGQLIGQFLGEAVLTALVSLALAFAAAEMLLPVLDRFLGRSISLYETTNATLLLVVCSIAVVAGFVSGIYPAVVLSRFRPIVAFRPEASGQPWFPRVRSVLVVLQFAVSIGLGIAAGIVFSQVRYARRMDLGFRHHDMLIIWNANMRGHQQSAFADALRANPGVKSVGLSNEVPFDSSMSNSLVQVSGQPNLITLNTVVVGPDYAETYGIPLVAGRLLSASRADDRLSGIGIATGGVPGNEGRNVLINAAAARRLGFTPHAAVGKTVIFNHDHVHIVGVLANAKVDGALSPVAPTVYIYVPSSAMNISVRLRSRDIRQTLRFVERTWHAFLPAVAIQRSFLDRSLGQLYRRADRQGVLFAVLVVIAVLIGCLGLYGLAVFSAERYTKEVGIRKVSGARTRDIVKLMLWRISVPVVVANVIAWPVSYFYMQRWLESFAYRIALDGHYFVGAGGAALLIAWATVLANSVHLARRSPVHALRYE